MTDLPGPTHEREFAQLAQRLGFAATNAATLGPAAEAPRAAALELGESIGRYLVLDELGAGAMGVVYAAYDPKLDRKIALKLLAPLAGGRTALARRRLRREAQALAKLAHPNVVGVYDVDVHAGQLYVAMEFIAGQTLRSWMSTQPRSWQAILDVFMAAGRGLAAAHAAGLIHRDFKPDNVMIGEDGRVRVMDFGLARHQEELPSVEALSTSPSLDCELERDEGELGPRTHEPPTTRTGAMMGTPAYMAPEQFGGQADARSDQFGFGVALYEGLYGERPFAADSLATLLETLESGTIRSAPRGSTVPAWLRAVILRALAAEPAQRWPSMDALLEALADDPGQRRRRWAGGALVAALVAGLISLTLSSRERGPRACEGFEAKLAGIWDDEVAARVATAFEDTGLVYAAASFDEAAQRLDGYTQRWVAAREEACAASQRGEQSGELLDLRMACLDAGLGHVAATVELLEAPDEDIVREAVEAVAGLPRLERCADVEALRAERPPPEDPELAARVELLDAQLVQFEALYRASKYALSLELAAEVARQAEALDYEPLQVRAWLARAAAQQDTADYEGAETTLRRAYAAAVRLNMVPEAAQATARLVVVVGYRLARHEDGRRWAEHAEPLAQAVGTPEAEALVLDGLGVVALAEGKLDEARAHLERALALREQALGTEHPVLAHTLNNLGSVVKRAGQLDVARGHYERALSIREQSVGPDHPDLASPLNNLGSVAQEQAQFDDARAYYERALAIYEQTLSPEHPNWAILLTNLGHVAHAAGKLDDARAYYQRALAIREQALGPDHPSLANALNSLGSVAQEEERFADARVDYERALAILETAHGPDHPRLAIPLTNLGAVAHAEGSHDHARAQLERALAIAELAYGPDHPDLAYPLTALGNTLVSLDEAADAVAVLERALSLRSAHAGDPTLLADTRFALARALSRLPTAASRERGRELAELAATAYGAAGERKAEELAELRSWLDELAP